MRQCGALSPEAGVSPGAGGLAPPRRGVMENGARAGTSPPARDGAPPEESDVETYPGFPSSALRVSSGTYPSRAAGKPADKGAGEGYFPERQRREGW